MEGYEEELESQPQWVKMQHKTFVRWVNAKLPHRSLHIEALVPGLHSCVVLIHLLINLSGKEFVSEKYKSTMDKDQRFVKLENGNKVFVFLEQEGIKTVGIGAEDIVDGNLKLDLGLIWTLIQSYQISLATQLAPRFKSKTLSKRRKKIASRREAPPPKKEPSQSKLTTVKVKLESPKKPEPVPPVAPPAPYVHPEAIEPPLRVTYDDTGGAHTVMLNYVNAILEHYPQAPKIKDFSTSLQDGIVLTAVVDALSPGIMNVDQVDPNNGVENNRIAMKVADEEFDVVQLLDAEDLEVSPDEKSVVTYVSLLRAAHRQLIRECEEEGLYGDVKKEEPVVVPPPSPPREPTPEPVGPEVIDEFPEGITAEMLEAIGVELPEDGDIELTEEQWNMLGIAPPVVEVGGFDVNEISRKLGIDLNPGDKAELSEEELRKLPLTPEQIKKVEKELADAGYPFKW